MIKRIFGKRAQTGQQVLLALFGLPTIRARGRLRLDLGRVRAAGPLRTMDARQRQIAVEKGFARLDGNILVPVLRGGAAALVREVNFTSAGGSTSMVLTVDATGFQAGHVLVLCEYHRGATTTSSLSAVADTQSNTWAVGTKNASASSGIATATCALTTGLSSAGSDTITLTFTQSTITNTVVQILEFSGMVTAAGFLDANPAVTATNGTTVSGPAITTTTDDVIVGFFGTQNTITVSSQNGWTYAGTQAQTGGPTRLDSVYIEEAVASTYTPQVTYSSASSGARQATVALKVQTTTPVSNTCGMPVAVEGGLASTAVEPIQTSQALAVTGRQPEEAVKPVSKTATL